MVRFTINNNKFSIICQTPESSMLGGRYKGIREGSEILCESITAWTDKSLR